MKALDIIIANPIVSAIHVIRFALRKPHMCPILFFFELTNLVIAEKAGCLSEISRRGVLMATRSKSMLIFIF